MGSLSIWHWIVVVVIVLLVFGKGKISDLMGDVAQGIKAFKKGMADDTKADAETPKDGPKIIDHAPAPGATTNASPNVNARTESEKRFEGGKV
jgi:sec-independent protein translocase protein TatA